MAQCSAWAISVVLGLAGAATADTVGLADSGFRLGLHSAAPSLVPTGLRPDEPEAATDLPISNGTRFYFRASAWYTFLDGSLAYGSPVNGATADLDLERTLGYDTDLPTLRGEFGLTFSKKFHLDFAINGPFNYDGTTTETITFGDDSYTANADSELDFVTFEANFAYDMVQQDRLRVWIGAGIRAVALHFEIDGQATDQNGNPIGIQQEDLDGGAAVPVVGLGLRYDISRNFYVAGRAMGLYVGDYGNAYDVSAELGWDFARNFGVFVGYKLSHFEAHEIEIDDTDLDIDATMHGPYAGIEFRF